MTRQEATMLESGPKRFTLTLAVPLIAFILTQNAYFEDYSWASGAVQLDKQEILLGVESVYSQIEDINVSFSFNALKAPANNLHARSHKTAVVKASKLYLKHTYGADPEYSTTTFVRKVAFNGAVSTTYTARNGSAVVETRKSKEADTQGSGFFDLMLLNQPRPDSDGASDQSLLSLLRSKDSRLRAALEEVDGHPCHVVDLIDASTKPPRMTVWVDCERGFLPLRHIYRIRPKYDAIIMKFSIEEAIQLKEGLWFAVKGRKMVYPAVNIPEIGPGLEHVMEVDGWKEGEPALYINQGISDSFFDLWLHLPIGTFVWDKDNDHQWIVKQGDYWGMADEVLEILQYEHLQIIEHEALGDVNPAPPEKHDADSAAAPDNSLPLGNRPGVSSEKTDESHNLIGQVLLPALLLALVAAAAITYLAVRKSK